MPDKAEQNNKNFLSKKIFGGFLIFCFVFVLFGFLNIKSVSAVVASKGGVLVSAPGVEGAQGETTLQSITNYLKAKADQFGQWAWEKSGSVSFWQAIRSALNTIAYDTATYIGSGGDGKKPLFITEGWGDYLSNIGDNAAGVFIEDLGRSSNWGEFNLCNPSLAVKAVIGLGLVKMQRPSAPDCKFSEIITNWETEINRPDFLKRFQTTFNPTGNDLMQAFVLQVGVIEEQNLAKEIGEKARVETGGWLDISDIAGNRKNPPGETKSRLEQTRQIQAATFGQNTEDAFEDAINTFLNQLAITLFNKLMGSIGEDLSPFTKPYSGNFGGLGDYNAGPGGNEAGQENLRQLLEPDFAVRGDYDILAELTQCPDPTKAGPTNCVIMEKFSQAVINKLTVGEAMKQGYLNPNGVFGFTADGLEPAYNEGYPYRSMIILRKFRIIPVGWEVAAQYIKECPQANGAECPVGIDGTKNLKNLVNCFSAQDDYGDPNETYSWCEGLVDPAWVLKAPVNYCKREGPGPEIISKQVIGAGEDSELAVLRNDKYCGDEQSCIKENDDGSCQLYGYCTEERRKWAFDGKSCDAKYNTCETFRTKKGQTISYLKNTLDYGNGVCDSENIGCNWYCEDYNNSNSAWSCTTEADGGEKIFFDRDAGGCKDSEEGCHEFIRINGTGANLITNSSFENNNDLAGTIWGSVGAQNSEEFFDGAKSFNLTASLDKKAVIIGPETYSVVGQAYSLSFYAKNCGTGGQFGIEDNLVNLNTDSSWKQFSLTYIYPITAPNRNKVNITIKDVGASCVIDAIKLEQGERTSYDDYRGSGLIYQKLEPDYLNCTGGANDPEECDNFVAMCSSADVGCELYTSVSDGVAIPARVIAQDYCPAECVGYDTYVQKETVFDSMRDSYFIPKTAKTCSAPAAGCDEFTNLDAIEAGGEGVEYYTSLRQCLKTNNLGVPIGAGTCGEFYTWEGSDETGYQLRVFQLKENSATKDPAVTEDDSLLCNAGIYNLDSTDPSYNSDCRQFYNTQGGFSYHSYNRTITCSNDCHPYRRTEANTDPEITEQGGCSANLCSSPASDGAEKCWDNSQGQGVCRLCKGGGVWDSEHGACLYNAIPGEGQTCGASQNGCREYSGNTGNNMRVVLNNDFESGDKQGWAVPGEVAGDNPNGESLVVNGASLFVRGGNANITLGDLAQEGSSYVLSFIAKAQAGPVKLAAEFNNGTVVSAFSETNLSAGEWHIYKLNLANLDHNVGVNEKLALRGDGGFYIDDIKLTEIMDRYYIIKNSWNTPQACYKDIFGNPVGALYNLGCDEYRDRDNNTHYLHSFNKLCSDSAVGCELMIDTHNSSDYKADNFNVGDVSEINVPADNYTYVTYDKKKQCAREDKGCQYLGESHQYGDQVLFKDVYLKNNPDEYNNILCSSSELMCEEWTTVDTATYFKDPGDYTCDWRQAKGAVTGSWGWYKKKIKRCDDGSNGGTKGDKKISVSQNMATLENKICLTDNDCSGSSSCILDDNDYSCPTDSDKTFGYGGMGNQVKQPTMSSGIYWAGLCPAAQAGCTEYIDPLSQFSSNIIFNSDFSQDVDGDGADGWSQVANGEQDIKLEQNTLYVLAAEGNNKIEVDSTLSNLRELNGVTNSLSGLEQVVIVESAPGERASKAFYTSEFMGPGNLNLKVFNAQTNNGSRVELKKAVVDYQLKRGLDKEACSGVVDFEQGCVLFNEREQNGSRKAELKYDADYNLSHSSYNTPYTAGDNKNSNALIKVNPDRVCNEWLACRSMVTVKDEKGGKEKNICFDVGLCDSVDNNGDCDSFVLEDKEERAVNITVDNFSEYNNVSGYAKVGFSGINDNSMKGLYPLGLMEQEGEIMYIPNSNFEFAGDNNYPIGWTWDSAIDGQLWDSTVFRVINNPIETQTEGIGSPKEGKGFLKLGSIHQVSSEFVDIVPDPSAEYVITAYINTINLSLGTAKIKVSGYDSAGEFKADLTDTINLQAGNDWTFKLAKFNVNNNVITRIKISLYAEPNNAGTEPTGNFYFDDIKIRPSLNSRNNWYSPQSCRLYSEDDSLSCDYFDDSGMRHKGWKGYCLEYDRYPGSSDACVLWWPVDKVKGDGIEEGIGYLGKTPVYYCLEATGVCGGDSGLELKYYCTKIAQAVSSAGQNKFWSGRVYEGSNYEMPFASSVSGAYIQWAAGNKEDIIINYSRGGVPFGSIVPPEPINNPYEWDSNASTIEIEPIYVFDQRTTINGTYAGTPYYGKNKTCSRSEQVNNFQYFTHEGGGDDHYLYCPAGMTRTNWWECGNGQNHGSAAVVNGCYAWERENNKGSECCGITCEMQGVFSIADTPEEAAEGIQRIFAQSYGVWEWIGDEKNGQYQEVGGNWGPPEDRCNGNGIGLRPEYDGDNGDLCAILPIVDSNNIKVNGTKGANVKIGGNQFVDLVFTSDVDSQQLPLTRYAINWGDNETTVVSGVEMRDKANTDNPHHLYHLYSYWDLKEKAAKGLIAANQCGDNCKTAGYCESYNGPYCLAQPKIQIKDNWGWCNGGTEINDCDQWEAFTGQIVVTEE